MNDIRIEFEPRIAFSSALLALFVVIVIGAIARRFAGRPNAVSQRYGLVAVRVAMLTLLTLVLMNPIALETTTSTRHKADVFYLLDSSQSMAVGDGRSRWEKSLDIIRDSEQVGNEFLANISLFRFGQRLTAVESSTWHQSADDFRPTDSDTQLAGALRHLTSRFGKTPPAAVVVFSDGRARDSADLEKMGEYFAKLKVPIHVVPVGEAGMDGDLAIIGVVTPPKVRKNSQVEVRVFLRSYGYDDKRCELTVSSVDRNGKKRKLNSVPITVRSGIQSFSTNYQSGEASQKIEVSVAPLPDEMSVDNNRYALDVAIDRTKIRVLYVEGGAQTGAGINNITGQNPAGSQRGPQSAIQSALTSDPDIECVVLSAPPGARKLQRLPDGQGSGFNRGFPDTIAELAAFDALILSNVRQRSFTDEQLSWINQWVEKRGAGLCMIGGPNSFVTGGWKDSIVDQMLPVQMGTEPTDWNASANIKFIPESATSRHPIWHMVDNESANLNILRSMPMFVGCHKNVSLKSEVAATVLATAEENGTKSPALVVGSYGKGRTMAMTVPSTPPYANDLINQWGGNDQRNFAKFWRNVIYWLTEDSSIGRRRLVVTSDQSFYRPNEKVHLKAAAYDESSNRTSAYRLVLMIEPQGNLNDADPLLSPVLWPEHVQRTSGETSPYAAWEEEIEFPRVRGQIDYTLEFVLGPPPSAAAATQSVRLELTAYEDLTQVDSTSLDLRIVHDPYEQQNPFPDHDQLFKLAAVSGGTVLKDTAAIQQMLSKLPVPPRTEVTRKSPWWSQWWLLTTIIVLMSIDWFWRRHLGLG